MQQYSPQAMLSYANQAAAYHNAALQNSRLSNPQHIADSIYNMTAQVKTVLILVVGSVLHIMLTFEYEKNSLWQKSANPTHELCMNRTCI